MQDEFFVEISRNDSRNFIWLTQIVKNAIVIEMLVQKNY